MVGEKPKSAKGLFEALSLLCRFCWLCYGFFHIAGFEITALIVPSQVS
jgi:hypothetical protein